MIEAKVVLMGPKFSVSLHPTPPGALPPENSRSTGLKLQVWSVHHDASYTGWTRCECTSEMCW